MPPRPNNRQFFFGAPLGPGTLRGPMALQDSREASYTGFDNGLYSLRCRCPTAVCANIFLCACVNACIVWCQCYTMNNVH